MNLETVLLFLLSALSDLGKQPAIDLLQKEFVKNPDDYKALLYGVKAGLEHLKVVAAKTKTQVDDQAIIDVEAILTASGAKNGITI